MELLENQINDNLGEMNKSSSNLFKRMTNGDTFAIISPYINEISDDENKQKMVELKTKVRKLNLSFNQFISKWIEDGQSLEKQSLMIHNITLEQSIKLGKEFGQNVIIYKDSKSCREICTTEFKDKTISDFTEDIVRVFYNTSKNILNINEIKSFELYEIEQPKPSYFSK